MEFKPSEYQEDIFDFVKHGHGNAVISAVAGSGKSTTIRMLLDYIKPERNVLFLAFNSSIVEELKSKITRGNTQIKTIHSIGFSMIKYSFKEKNIKINENKYKNKLYSILENDRISDKKYIKNVLKLCDLGRFYLVNNENELLSVSNKYGLILTDDELDVSLWLINWGKESFNDLEEIDYTDMIYLPNVLNLSAFKYDFIIIDEAQDLSIAQMKLFIKCFKQGTRFIAVGDDNQCIYSFAGSNIDSFKKLKDMPNTIELPLSICYRCPKNIVKFAQKLVPEIEYKDDAIDGKIIFKAEVKDLIDGDMVICRNYLPLVKLYLHLLYNNVSCYIKGTDIGLNLLDIINSIDEANVQDVITQADNLLILYMNKNIESGNIIDDIKDSQEYNDLSDKIECLNVISIGLKTKQELIEKITNMFSDENKKGIYLSTIHKAKGLEADNVYILDSKLMPSKCAKQDWELIQEKNLMYVAYTRSKKIL